MPVLMPIIILFIFWIKYESSKTQRLTQRSSDAFWKKEQLATSVRNQNLDEIPFFTFHKEDLPILSDTDMELSELSDKLDHLSGKAMADLSDYTNTDLKLTYGTGKFKYLAECDDNFHQLMQTLNHLGRYFIRQGDSQTARRYLDYAVAHNTGITNTYDQLASLTK